VRRVTTSQGLACFPQHGADAAALRKAADAALYEAKELGRNRVQVAR
jgi:diguanylate cyclase (GGDEF)-like protein